MSYAIKQTYQNFNTGQRWTRVLPRRWKTRRGAERYAQLCLRWVTRPKGGEALDASDAVVFEETGGAR